MPTVDKIKSDAPSKIGSIHQSNSKIIKTDYVSKSDKDHAFNIQNDSDGNGNDYEMSSPTR